MHVRIRLSVVMSPRATSSTWNAQQHAGMAQNHNQARTETRRCKLNASDLGRSHDVARDSDDEEIANALAEHDLRRNTRVGASENDGDRFLSIRQLVTVRSARERVAAENARHEAIVPLSQAFERFQT